MNSNPEIARKLYLNCPFSQKDEAKALGARWDQVRKRWYVPEQSDLTKFQRWLPQVAISVLNQTLPPKTRTSNSQFLDAQCTQQEQKAELFFGAEEQSTSHSTEMMNERGSLAIANPVEARAPDAAEEAHEPQSAIISSENKRKSRKDKKYQTEEEKRAGKNANNKNYRLKKKQAIAALKNSTEFEPFQLTGDVSFCAPSPEQTQFFVEASTNNSVIASRPWGEQSFEVLVEGVIYELQQVGKVVCLGRVLNNSPDPTKATKKFVQPGFARLPKPITQGTLNYVVFEWFPCVTPEPEKHLIPGEILMEYLSDQWPHYPQHPWCDRNPNPTKVFSESLWRRGVIMQCSPSSFTEPAQHL